MADKKKPRVIIHNYGDGVFVLYNHKDVDVHWFEGAEYVSSQAYNSNAGDEELDNYMRMVKGLATLSAQQSRR